MRGPLPLAEHRVIEMTPPRRPSAHVIGPVRVALRIIALALIVAAIAAVPRPSRTQTISWTDAAGRPTPQALAAIGVLRDARSRGLRPEDYDAAALATRADALVSGDAPDARAAFDDALTRSVVRLLTHLHEGRVTPEALGFHLPDAHRDIDFVALARGVSESSDVGAAIAAVEPPYAGYAALEHALARYRHLASDSTLAVLTLPPRTLRPGDVLAGASALRHRLRALGDLATESPSQRVVDTIYDDALADGVRHFQRRHGLNIDGVIGPETRAQLRIPPAQRVEQIELTLERWRWLSDTPPDRFAVVNIPAFRLYVFQSDRTAAHPALRMNVIIGNAERRRLTPVFVGTMQEVVFRPYWDVPPDIARREEVPKIRRDGGYAEREGFEIVRGGESDARVYAMTNANLDRVDGGALRLRQRPGPNNAVGLIKFVFPNSYDVYMHGTPATELFGRTRRDFSHGCIRIEDPPALAALVLRGQPGWDSTSIDQAMHGERTLHVAIAQPLGVFVLYATTVVGDDGTVYFYPDVYGRDAQLARALLVSSPRPAR